MSRKSIKMKNCPFCGGKCKAYILEEPDNPAYWRNGLWHWHGEHDDDCILRFNEMFGGYHYGEAVNGKPTEELLERIAAWNRRAYENTKNES